MTLAGWCFMTVACSGITALVAFCYWRILRTPEAAEEVHAPLELEVDPEP